MLANDGLMPEPVTGDQATQASPAEASQASPAGASQASPAGASQAPPAGASAITDDATVAATAVDRQGALRALRSLEATEARLERNAKRDAEEARGKLVQELLPVLDNLDRTIRAAHANRGDPAMLEGVRLVRQQLEGVLRGYGVERVDAIDQRFDPGLHEAIGVAPVSDPRRHGLVIHQAEPGYRLAGKLLRPARVNVGKYVAPPQVVHRPLWR